MQRHYVCVPPKPRVSVGGGQAGCALLSSYSTPSSVGRKRGTPCTKNGRATHAPESHANRSYPINGAHLCAQASLSPPYATKEVSLSVVGKRCAPTSLACSYS